ncbi:MAG: division/cell wall cluster transcriptional repressor MraZ [Acidimicrobiia bacterium]|jgi:MraZ protein
MKDFLGEHRHSLDAKGRLILPMDFRSPLADGAVIGIGQHNCLVVYTPEEWQTVAQRIREMSREGDMQLDAARAFFAGAREVKPDAQGRVPIAADQREYASLEREVVVVGQFSRIEIWDAERWDERRVDGQKTLAAAASLPGFGI